MLFANLMPWNVSPIQCSFLISASEASDGPVNVSLVQFVLGAGVAVEQRADRVVAVEVDAPGAAVADAAASASSVTGQ